MEASKHALLVSSVSENMYETAIRLMGWDAVVGQERFFSLPHWWSFAEVERGSLVASSVELLKQFGFVAYFLQLSKSKAQEEVQADPQKEFMKFKRNSEISKNDVSSAQTSVPQPPVRSFHGNSSLHGRNVCKKFHQRRERIEIWQNQK